MSRYFLPLAHFFVYLHKQSSDQANNRFTVRNMRMTRSRRRISSLSRSMPFVVRSRLRYFSGSRRTAVASSKPFYKTEIAFAALASYISTVCCNNNRAVSRSGASKIARTRGYNSFCNCLGVASRIFRINESDSVATSPLENGYE